MCERCSELDRKIDRYLRLARNVTDEPLVRVMNQLKRQSLEEIAALHPEMEKTG